MINYISYLASYMTDGTKNRAGCHALTSPCCWPDDTPLRPSWRFTHINALSLRHPWGTRMHCRSHHSSLPVHPRVQQMEGMPQCVSKSNTLQNTESLIITPSHVCLKTERRQRRRQGPGSNGGDDRWRDVQNSILCRISSIFIHSPIIISVYLRGWVFSLAATSIITIVITVLYWSRV